MRKIILMILIIFNSLLFSKEVGITFDVARHSYSITELKKLIDIVKKNGGTFVQIGFSNDESYTLESKLLGQSRGDKYVELKNGRYINNNTGKEFFTLEQIKDLIRYAKAKKIELIPEINAPGHSDAILKLLKTKDNARYQKIKDASGNKEFLAFGKEETLKFVEELYTEVIDMFKDANLKHFHIGGDEVVGSNVVGNKEEGYYYINYINNISSFLKNKKLKPRMWNDEIRTTYLDRLDKNIEITYWKQRDNNIADVNQLIAKGFDVLNYNEEYLYYIPTGKEMSKEDIRNVEDIRNNFKLGLFFKPNGTKYEVNNVNKVIGASIAVWSEEVKVDKSKNQTTENVIKNTEILFEELSNKIK